MPRGASFYFLDMSSINIKGESKKKGHVGQVEMDSFNTGISHTGSAHRGEALGTGRCHMHPFSFDLEGGAQSAPIVRACLGGEYIPQIVFWAQRTGLKSGIPEDYLKMTFKDCSMVGWNSSGSDPDQPPRESVAFSYTSFVMEYKEHTRDGSVNAGFRGGYDAKLNKKI